MTCRWETVCVPCVQAAAEWALSRDWRSTATRQNRGERSDDTGWHAGCHKTQASPPDRFLPCTTPEGPEGTHTQQYSHSCASDIHTTSYDPLPSPQLNIESYLEENKSTKPKHFSLHGASEVSFPPEIHSGEDVRKSNQPSPHAMTPLHVEDELKLWQSHVMVHSENRMTTDI